MPDLLEPLLALTERQADVLLYIGQYFALNRELPTHAELRAHLQLGERTNVAPYLRQLIDRGYLEKTGAQVRGRIKLTQQGIERLAVLLEDKDRAGDYQELRALIATIQRVV